MDSDFDVFPTEKSQEFHRGSGAEQCAPRNIRSGESYVLSMRISVPHDSLRARRDAEQRR